MCRVVPYALHMGILRFIKCDIMSHLCVFGTLSRSELVWPNIGVGGEKLVDLPFAVYYG